MDSAEQAARCTRRALPWAVALVVAAFVVRVPTFRLPLDQDGSVFAYVAKTWADGGLPYRDAWDHKPPLTYIVYRGLFLVGPATGPGVNLTLRLGSAACDAATAVLLFLLARRLFGLGVGLVAGLVYAVFAGAPILQLEAFQPERLAVLCTVAGVLAAVAYADSRNYALAALSGLLFGLGLVAKQIVAPVGVAVWAWLSWDAFRADGRAATRRVVVHSALLAVGAVVPWGLAMAYFAARGAFADFWECVWRFNLFYAEEHRKGSLLAGVVKAVKVMRFHHPFLWLSAAGGVVAALARPELRRWGVLVLVWLAAAFAALILPGQFAYYYYLPTVAPLALAVGVALAWLWRTARASAVAAAGAAAAALLLLALLALGAWQSYDTLRRRLDPRQTDVVVARVAEHLWSQTNEGDRIYMRGGRPQVYVLSGRRNICPFLYDFYYGLPPDKAYHYQPHKLKAILDALERWRPPFIVVTARGDGPPGTVFGGAYEKLDEYFPDFLKVLNARYELDKAWPARPVSLMVFRRKAAP